MKKALISPAEQVLYISSWVTDRLGMTFPVCEPIQNSSRVVQVEDNEFEVAEPLFWVACEDIITPSGFYYDLSDSTIKAVPADAIKPE